MRVVIAAKNYSDFLETTLPAWRSRLPMARLVVVCGMGERLPSMGAAAGVLFVSTPAWDRDGAALNKAAAIDDGLHDLEPGEVVIVADADVVPFGLFPAKLEPDTLYGCARYACPTPDILKQHEDATLTRPQLTLIPPRRGGEPEYGRWTAEAAAAECTGYFHAFRYRPGLTFGSYPTAAGYDLAFRNQFTRRVGLTDFYLLHLGELSRENWKGRVVPRWPLPRDLEVRGSLSLSGTSTEVPLEEVRRWRF